jgi:hypothetical protein
MEEMRNIINHQPMTIEEYKSFKIQLKMDTDKAKEVSLKLEI